LKHHSPTSSPARPLDALLAQYASGALPPPLHVLVASHLDLNRESEVFVGKLETLGGLELARQEPRPLASRDSMLADIMKLDPVEPGAEDTRSTDPVFTPALLDYVGCSSADVPWRTVLPGVKEHVISDRNGVEAKLFWIKAGRKIPSHTHEGQEVTLVLKGGFADISGRYRRGEIAVADENIDHKPVADMDEDCICFAVTDAPLKLTGPVARFLQGLLSKH
jgi:putative transcriptional regulator